MIQQNYRKISIITDILASGTAWSLFFIYRKLYIESLKFGVQVPFHPDIKFFASLLFISAFWFLIYYSTGSYRDIRRQNQKENALTLFVSTAAGCFILFFMLILDDTVISYRNYYQSFFVMFVLQYILVFSVRFVILSCKNSQFRMGTDRFRVIIVGETDKIKGFCAEHNSWLTKGNFHVVGYILSDMDKGSTELLRPATQIRDLDRFIDEVKAEEVFIVSEISDKDELERILYRLFRKDVHIRLLPELYLYLNIPVKAIDIFHAPLLLFSKDILPLWQQAVKTFLDIVLSIVAIILLTPLIVTLIMLIKTTSKGPVIYSHERIGKNGKPFKILKFRSMYVDSEPEGPRLASRNDTRMTSIGRFMRKRRLDEIPNFINVFKGDMSLVGPRPERAFYIEQIIDRAPQYSKLHLVKPGITSWGQVKYGYAESIDEMMQRMRYDLVYIENRSLYIDVQVLLKTIRIIIKGQGV